MTTWVSPDRRIVKEVICKGQFVYKPAEGSHCTITITDSPTLLQEFTKTVVVIGDSDGDMWRLLDIGLMTMSVGEKSKFTLDLGDNTVTLVVELVDLIFNGFIYDWGMKKRYEVALAHKDKGNKFFQNKNNKEAAHRFCKALKVLSSIPIDVTNMPEEIDGLKCEDISRLKMNLYNNLASCYFRNNCWDVVIDLCSKVLNYDSNNVKALYKIGVAYENDRNFEKAHDAFTRVLELDKNNTASAEHLSVVKAELKQSEMKSNDMMKKMFTAVLKN